MAPLKCGLLSVTQHKNQDFLIVCCIYPMLFLRKKQPCVILEPGGWQAVRLQTKAIYSPEPSVKVSTSPSHVFQASFWYGTWQHITCGHPTAAEVIPEVESSISQSVFFFFIGMSNTHYKKWPDSFLTCSFMCVKDKKGPNLTATAQHQCEQLHQGEKQQGSDPCL